MKTNRKTQRGFTLVELIVYLALFAILFGGAIAGTYSLIESGGRNQSRIMMQQEGEFLLAKINWIVSSAETAQVPTGDRLLVSSSLDNFELKQSGNNLVLIKDSNPELILNNSSVRINNLSFSTVESNQKGIAYAFDLETNTPNGTTIISHFESTVYLRK